MPKPDPRYNIRSGDLVTVALPNGSYSAAGTVGSITMGKVCVAWWYAESGPVAKWVSREDVRCGF